MVLNIFVFRCLNGRTGNFEGNYKKSMAEVLSFLFYFECSI